MHAKTVNFDLIESTGYSAIGCWPGKLRPLTLAFLLGVLLTVCGRLLLPADAAPAPAPPPPPTPEQIAARIHAATPEDVARLRTQALQSVFGGALPTAQAQATPIAPPYPSVAQAVRFPGEGYYLVNRHPNGKLAIYHAGHDQLALREGGPTVEAMLAAGYDVLAFSMPPTPHSRYHALRPFLEPVALGLNYALARKPYRDVLMAGISGGGWTTVVYSALDTRIRHSYPIAGSLPVLVQVPHDGIDFEQRLPGLQANYLDLYLMAASDGRQQVQVFNSDDPCCFAGTRGLLYRDTLANTASRLGGSFDVVVVRNDEHSLTPGLARMMFPSL